ncbi:MAG: DNA repair protein RadC [Bacteroidales bacterium]|nr:DNA repair protein RadC [Candidatus Colimorpha onthohippi]
MDKGTKVLSNAELLAILLNSAPRGHDVVEMSRKLLEDEGNSLERFTNLGWSGLCKKRGIGPAKSVTIMAALELGERLRAEKLRKEIVNLRSSSDIASLISPDIAGLNHEQFWILLMNNHLQLIHKCPIGIGGITSVNVDVRKIFQLALNHNATCFAVAHNHPSGVVKPSVQDMDITKKIMEASKVMDIKLVDHVIVAYNIQGVLDLYSFCDHDWPSR